MTTDDVDACLAGVAEPARGALEELRACLRQLLPALVAQLVAARLEESGPAQGRTSVKP